MALSSTVLAQLYLVEVLKSCGTCTQLNTMTSKWCDSELASAQVETLETFPRGDLSCARMISKCTAKAHEILIQGIAETVAP